MHSVPPVVDGEHGGRDRAERDAQEDGVCRHREGLQVVGAADGRETEEYEHRRLSERRVGNGLRTAHVRIGGNDRGDADQREDPAAEPDEHGGVEQCQHDERENGPSGGRNGDPALGGCTGKPPAVACFRLLLRIAQIVLHVADDLHEQSDRHREERGQGIKSARFEQGEA